MMKKSVLRIAQLALAVLLICPAFGLAQELKVIQLLPPQMDGGRPLMQVLKDRVSSRNFSPEKLPIQVLSNMLWAAFGVNQRWPQGVGQKRWLLSEALRGSRYAASSWGSRAK